MPDKEEKSQRAEKIAWEDLQRAFDSGVRLVQYKHAIIKGRRQSEYRSGWKGEHSYKKFTCNLLSNMLYYLC